MLSSETANIQRASAATTTARGTLTKRKLRTMVKLPPIRVRRACSTTASAKPASESTSHIGQPACRIVVSRMIELSVSTSIRPIGESLKVPSWHTAISLSD